MFRLCLAVRSLFIIALFFNTASVGAGELTAAATELDEEAKLLPQLQLGHDRKLVVSQDDGAREDEEGFLASSPRASNLRQSGSNNHAENNIDTPRCRNLMLFTLRCLRKRFEELRGLSSFDAYCYCACNKFQGCIGENASKERASHSTYDWNKSFRDRCSMYMDL